MKKIVCLLLALALSIAVFAGCGGNDNSSSGNPPSNTSGGENSGTQVSESGVDISSKAKLVMWTPGTAPRDLQRISGKLNEMTQRDLNATLEWNMYVDVQKLNLLLTSGEHIDVIYAANYQNYAVYAAKDAFLPCLLYTSRER